MSYLRNENVNNALFTSPAIEKHSRVDACIGVRHLNNKGAKLYINTDKLSQVTIDLSEDQLNHLRELLR